MTVETLIAWLRSVEDMAFSIYSAAAEIKGLSPRMSKFILRLAEDEAWHYHMMGSAAALVAEQDPSPVLGIVVDGQIQARIEAPLRELQERMSAGDATEEHLMKAVVEAEYSEWNDIFLYVVAMCSEISTEFQYLASAIQSHERRIENFMTETKADPKLAETLAALPRVWTEKLLVVDDEPAMRTLLERVLSRYGEVTCASDGQEALNLVGQQFFNAIVTDVDMPVLDGIAFTEQAIEGKPRLSKRFVICTGNVTNEVRDAADLLGIPLLAKPVALAELRSTIETILNEDVSPGN